MTQASQRGFRQSLLPIFLADVLGAHGICEKKNLNQKEDEKQPYVILNGFENANVQLRFAVPKSWLAKIQLAGAFIG